MDFNSVSSDIILEILSRVPPESVFECKLVCQKWKYQILHPCFNKIHSRNHQPAAADDGKLAFIALTTPNFDEKNDEKNDDSFQYLEYCENLDSATPIEYRIRKVDFKPPFGDDNFILNSCNGLICVAQFPNLTEKIYICNPITKEVIMLPEIEKVGQVHDGATGFGYASSTDEYKVVTIMSEYVYIYTLGSGKGWRNLGKFKHQPAEEEGIFLNGSLYWLEYESHKIIVFDLAQEKFSQHVSLPLPRIDDFDNFYHLGVLDGCLSFAINHTDVDETEYWDVWLLNKKKDTHCMKEREEHQSLDWSREFKVYDHELFAVTKSRAVLACNGNRINSHKDSKSERIVDFKEHFKSVIPHRNTFVSLKDLGEGDIKIMESVEVAETENRDQLFN